MTKSTNYALRVKPPLTQQCPFRRETGPSDQKRMRRFMSQSTTPITDFIRSSLTRALKPAALEIRNDSHKHAHHAPMKDVKSKESHFWIRVVSNEFEGKPLPARHRMVYHLLASKMDSKNGIHALQLDTKTPAEASAHS